MAQFGRGQQPGILQQLHQQRRERGIRLGSLGLTVQAVAHQRLQLLVVDAGVFQDLADVRKRCFQQLEQQVRRGNLGALTADAQGSGGFQRLA